MQTLGCCCSVTGSNSLENNHLNRNIFSSIRLGVSVFIVNLFDMHMLEEDLQDLTKSSESRGLLGYIKPLVGLIFGIIPLISVLVGICRDRWETLNDNEKWLAPDSQTVTKCGEQYSSVEL